MSRYAGWDDAAVRKAQERQPRGKYGAKKVLLDGISFDSKAEGARYSQLKMLEAAGLINQIACHPSFAIWMRGIFICDVVLDFKYWDLKLNRKVYEDVKGKDNPLSKLKRKLVEAEYGITVEIIK